MADLGDCAADGFAEIVRWLSPPDPWTDHDSARQLHEPETGTWLLQSSEYHLWKSGLTRHLWLHGKPGCGKTVLCSAAVEDIRTHCENVENAGLGVFYFSFSDESKQTYDKLIRSLIVQLGSRDPGLSMLRQAYEKSQRKGHIGRDELKKILSSCLASYDEVYLLLDALDECPGTGGVRQSLLRCLEELLRLSSNVRVFMTSREVPDIQHYMCRFGAEAIHMDATNIDMDIQKFLSSQLTDDWRLSRLDLATKRMIKETLARKADGMFRWAYCHLETIKRFKNTRPRNVEAALLALPETLNDTYERMLAMIDLNDRATALTLLRWLAYAHSPLRLDELAEATVVDPTSDPAADGFVNLEDRGSREDTLEILAGFVTIEGVERRDSAIEITSLEASHDDAGRSGAAYPVQHSDRSAKVKLAHLSVKEYLQSQYILTSSVRGFHLDPAREHRFLAQSCLVYLMFYSKSACKTSTGQDLRTFPLLGYAASSWFHHSRLQKHGRIVRELLLLALEDFRRDWLRIYQPDRRSHQPFTSLDDMGTGLYYASVIGLDVVVADLLITTSDVNAQGGKYGSALQAASAEGHEKVVRLLLGAGANLDSEGGYYGTALYAASWEGHVNIVQMLVNAGANVNLERAYYGNALQTASFKGHEEVVRMLLKAGARINAQIGHYGNALQPASREGHDKVVRMLLDAGADVNAYGGLYGTALQAASSRGFEKVVRILIDAGADVNVQGGYYGNALRAASFHGRKDVVQMLEDAGASLTCTQADELDVGAIDFLGRDGLGRSHLHRAASNGFDHEVRSHLAKGSNVNEPDNQRWTPLHWAAYFGRSSIVILLLQSGAERNLEDWQGWTARHVAAFSGQKLIADMLAVARPREDAQDTLPVAGKAIHGYCDFCRRVSVYLGFKLPFGAKTNLTVESDRVSISLHSMSVSTRL